MAESSGPVSASRERPAAVVVPLWRNKNFQLLWSGTAFTLFANEMGVVAFPLVILGLTDSPALAGLYGAVQLAASVLVGIPAGAWVDRHDRRRLLLCAEALKATVLLLVAAALLTGRAQVWMLLAGAAVMGAAAPFAGASRMLMVRKAVPPQQLTSALTQDEVRGNTVSLAGPSVAGYAYGFGAGVPIVVAGALSGLALLLASLVDRSLGRIDPGAPRDAAGPAAGLRILWGNPVLRLGTVFAAASNLAIAPLILVVVFILQQQDAPPLVIGATSAGLAVGGLLGTLLVKPMQRIFRPGVLLLVVGTFTTILIAALSVVRGPWVMAVVLALIGVGGPTVRILVDILIFRQVSDEQRGRTVTAFMTVLGTGSALGVLVSGLLLELAPWVAVGGLAALLLVAMFVGYASPAIRRADWPEEV